MPTYDYKCPQCEAIEEQTHSIKEDPVYHCTKCGVEMKKMFSPNSSGFTFGKMGTITIHRREKDLRKKRSVEMAERQKNNKRFVSNIRPNVGGVETDSWSDSQKLAKSKGLNSDSYTRVVEKEKSGQIIKTI